MQQSSRQSTVSNFNSNSPFARQIQSPHYGYQQRYSQNLMESMTVKNLNSDRDLGSNLRFAHMKESTESLKQYVIDLKSAYTQNRFNSETCQSWATKDHKLGQILNQYDQNRKKKSDFSKLFIADSKDGHKKDCFEQDLLAALAPISDNAKKLTLLTDSTNLRSAVLKDIQQAVQRIEDHANLLQQISLATQIPSKNLTPEKIQKLFNKEELQKLASLIETHKNVSPHSFEHMFSIFQSTFQQYETDGIKFKELVKKNRDLNCQNKALLKVVHQVESVNQDLVNQLQLRDFEITNMRDDVSRKDELIKNYQDVEKQEKKDKRILELEEQCSNLQDLLIEKERHFEEKLRLIEDHNSELESQAKQAELERRQAVQELQQLKVKRTSDPNSCIQKDELVLRYKRLEADHNTLKQNYEKYKNQQAVNVEKALRELSETRVHLKDAQGTIKRLEEMMEKKDFQKAQLNQEMKEKKEKKDFKQAQLDSLNLENNQLKDKLLQLEGERTLMFNEINEKLQKIHELEQEVMALQIANENMQEQLDEARPQEEKSDILTSFTCEIRQQKQKLTAQAQQMQDQAKRRTNLESQITQMAEEGQRQIQSLQQQIKILTKRSSELEALVGQREASLRQKDNEIAQLKQVYEEAKEQMASSNKVNQQRAAQFIWRENQLKEQLEILNGQVQTEQRNSKEKDAQISQLQGLLKVQSKELELQQELKSIQAQLRFSQESVRQMEAQIKQQNQTIHDLEQANENLTELANRLKLENKQLQGRAIASIQGQSIENEQQLLKTEFSRLQGSFAKQQQLLHTSQSQLDSLQQTHHALSLEKDQLVGKFSDSVEQSEKLVQLNQDLQSKIEQTKVALVSERSSHANTKALLEQLSQQAQLAGKEKQELEHLMQQESARLIEQVKVLVTQVEGLRNETELKDNEIRSLSDKSTRNHSELQQKEKQLGSMISDLAQLKGRLQEQEEKVVSQQVELARLTKQSQDFKMEVTNLGEENSQLKQRVQELVQKLESVEANQNDDLDQYLESLQQANQAQIKQYQEEIEDLKQAMLEMEIKHAHENKMKESEFEEIQSLVSQLQQMLTKAQEKADLLESEKEQLRERLKGLEKKLHESHQQQDDLQQKLLFYMSAEQQLTEVKEQLSEQLGEEKQKVAEQQEALKLLQEQHTTLQAKYDSQLQELKEKMAQLDEYEILERKQSIYISNLEGNNTQLQQRIVTLESAKRDAEKELQSTRDQQGDQLCQLQDEIKHYQLELALKEEQMLQKEKQLASLESEQELLRLREPSLIKQAEMVKELQDLLDAQRESKVQNASLWERKEQEMKKEVMDLMIQNDQLIKTIEEYQQGLSEKEEEIQLLTTQLEAQVKLNKDLQKLQLAESQQKIGLQEQEKKLAEYQSQFNEYGQRISELEGQLRHLQPKESQLAKAEEVMKYLQEQLSNKEQRLMQNEQQLRELFKLNEEKDLEIKYFRCLQSMLDEQLQMRGVSRGQPKEAMGTLSESKQKELLQYQNDFQVLRAKIQQKTVLSNIKEEVERELSFSNEVIQVNDQSFIDGLSMIENVVAESSSMKQQMSNTEEINILKSKLSHEKEENKRLVDKIGELITKLGKKEDETNRLNEMAWNVNYKHKLLDLQKTALDPQAVHTKAHMRDCLRKLIIVCGPKFQDYVLGEEILNTLFQFLDFGEKDKEQLLDELVLKPGDKRNGILGVLFKK